MTVYAENQFALNKYILILLLSLLLLGCSESTGELVNECLEVQHKGALKNFMMQGDISAKADLRDLKARSDLYALGAVENLKGELMILDSRAFITSVQDDSIRMDNTFDHEASLLVYAQVPHWVQIKVPDSVKQYGQFETYIAMAAKEAGIDTSNAFPFRLRGNVTSADWHVIDWPAGDKEHTHEKHKTSGLNGTLTNESVEILGFYSTKHTAIFTHHTTNMHMHVKTADNRVAGHLDGLIIGNEMSLLLPKMK